MSILNLALWEFILTVTFQSFLFFPSTVVELLYLWGPGLCFRLTYFGEMISTAAFTTVDSIGRASLLRVVPPTTVATLC